MDRAKSKLATSKLASFFENDDDDVPQSSIFSTSTVKKSKREKEQEAAEAKKREEEAKAAKVYADFLDVFEGGDVVRRSTTSTFVRAGGAESNPAYAPSIKQPPEGPRNYRKSPSPPSAPRPKGKRAMDSFLEEIKKDQAAREARFSRDGGHGGSATAMAAYESQSGSRDRGDPLSSNIFVANLPGHVTEQSLGNFFARAGPVASVKIMWPRNDASSGPGADMVSSRRTTKPSLSGFVSFMKRKDAETALREFDGFDWGGSILRAGWSKAVPVGPKPMYVSSNLISSRRSHSRSRSPRRDRSRDRYPSSRRQRSRSQSYSRSRSRSRSPRRRRRSRSRSRSPDRRSPTPMNEEEEVTDTFIRAIAAEVKGYGSNYEQSLKDKERHNPKYAFLRSDNRNHSFYRGLLRNRDLEGAEFDDDGYNSIYSSDSAEESERERTKKTALGRLARKRFEAMLRGMSGKRGEIARCMAFSLDHAEAANEIADIIIASLLVAGTPVPRKVARLHLICDILHNSATTVPSAWRFRQEFQSRLGVVFDHLANIYHSFPGRITADLFKKQITNIVDVWEDWIVFPPDFTSELRVRLEGATLTEEEPMQQRQTSERAKPTGSSSSSSYVSRFKTSAFHTADAEPVVNTDADMKDVDEDVDGIPMQEDDIDGEPVEDVDGDPMEDVDGEALGDVDGDLGDVDGETLDDVDGEPIAEDDVDGDPLE